MSFMNASQFNIYEHSFMLTTSANVLRCYFNLFSTMIILLEQKHLRVTKYSKQSSTFGSLEKYIYLSKTCQPKNDVVKKLFQKNIFHRRLFSEVTCKSLFFKTCNISVVKHQFLLLRKHNSQRQAMELAYFVFALKFISICKTDEVSINNGKY